MMTPVYPILSYQWGVYFDQRCLCYKAEKRLKKVTNLLQNLAKKWVFKFALKRWSSVLRHIKRPSFRLILEDRDM